MGPTKNKSLQRGWVLAFIPFLASLALTCGPRTATHASLPKAYDLPAPQRSAWESLRSEWMRSTFSRCLAESHIELSCGGCTTVMVRVRVSVDRHGRARLTPTRGGRVCAEPGDESIERCFLAPFEQIQLSEPLRNLDFEDVLGTGLSC